MLNGFFLVLTEFEKKIIPVQTVRHKAAKPPKRPVLLNIPVTCEKFCHGEVKLFML